MVKNITRDTKLIAGMVNNMFKKLYEKLIIRLYVRYGLKYGDELSYSFMGECVGSVEDMFKYFETKYCNLGYIPVSLNDWVIAGGYRGKSHIEQMLLIKRK